MTDETIIDDMPKGEDDTFQDEGVEGTEPEYAEDAYDEGAGDAGAEDAYDEGGYDDGANDAEGDDSSPTDEELDAVADAAIDVIRSILSHFDCEGAEINEYEGDDDEIILDICGGDLAILIGKRGNTLQAMQTVVSAITHRVVGFGHPVSVDVESYRHRQRGKIESMAVNAARRACSQGRDVKLREMNAYERRLVHMALRDDTSVTTHSEGSDPHRHVVVSPL